MVTGDWWARETPQRRVKRWTQCMKHLPMWTLGKVRCMQPDPRKQRGSFRWSNQWSPGRSGAILLLRQSSLSPKRKVIHKIYNKNLKEKDHILQQVGPTREKFLQLMFHPLWMICIDIIALTWATNDQLMVRFLNTRELRAFHTDQVIAKGIHYPASIPRYYYMKL